MAQVGIKNSWDLTAFVAMVKREGASFKYASNQVNKETGESFNTCVVTDYPSTGVNTFVGFSSNLGELTPEQLRVQKGDLQVVQLESGSYKVCKKGNGGWQDIF